jgi:probable biosynthetic protein (TIGR04098 family)
VSGWNDYDFVVQMPHMAPGEKLSEVELLKVLAAHQWESIATALRTRPSRIANDRGERLYGSVIDVEFFLGERHSLDLLGEDVRVHVKNRVRFYASKFVEGLFVIDDREIPDEAVASIKRREDLRSLGGSWACMTNAFIARGGGNLRLKVYKPAGADAADLQQLEQAPFGVIMQGRVQGSGEIEPLSDDAFVPLPAVRPDGVEYRIVPESDLNGAGLVYFARYEAMMNYGERRFLGERLALPISAELVSYLSTEHRRAFFFANASPTDTVDVRVSAGVLPIQAAGGAAVAGRYRIPLKLQFRVDLYRASDGTLMASSLVRKSLNVPGSAKAVLAEAERLLRRIGRG